MILLQQFKEIQSPVLEHYQKNMLNLDVQEMLQLVDRVSNI